MFKSILLICSLLILPVVSWGQSQYAGRLVVPVSGTSTILRITTSKPARVLAVHIQLSVPLSEETFTVTVTLNGITLTRHVSEDTSGSSLVYTPTDLWLRPVSSDYMTLVFETGVNGTAVLDYAY